MAVTLKVHPRLRPRRRADWLGVCRSSRGFKLDESARGELSGIAGLDQPDTAFTKDRNAMLSDLEEALGIYPDMERALDRHGPRAAHKVGLLRPFLKDGGRGAWDWNLEETHEAAHAVADWPGGALAWEFRLAGFPREAPEDPREFQQLFLLCAQLINEHPIRIFGNKRKESRGRTQKAYNRLMLELSEIFDRYAFIDNKKYRSISKAEFIAVALRAVGRSVKLPTVPYSRNSRIRRWLSNPKLRVHPQSKPWPRHRHSWETVEGPTGIRVKRCLSCKVEDILK